MFSRFFSAWLLLLLMACESPKYVPSQRLKEVYYCSSRAVTGGIHQLAGRARGSRRWGVHEVEGPTHLHFFDAPAMAQQMRAKVSRDGAKSVLLYVHGFNTSFEGSVRTTQRLTGAMLDARGGGQPCLPVFFSWPSANRVWHYGSDRNQVDMAAIDLAAFLRELERMNLGLPLDIVAHSMGSEVVLKSLLVLQARREAPFPSLRRMVLCAPDVENSKFDALLPFALAACGPSRADVKITLYMNEVDMALAASTALVNQGHQRAGRPVKVRLSDGQETRACEVRVPGVGLSGEKSDPQPIEGLEVLDVSPLYRKRRLPSAVQRLNLLQDVGHFYHETERVILDLCQFLATGKRATQRSQLRVQSYTPTLVTPRTDGDKPTPAPFQRTYFLVE